MERMVMRRIAVSMVMIACLVMCSAAIQAQTFTVRGHINETGRGIGVRPLANATVVLTPSGATAVSSSDGHYTISNVARGVYVMRVSAPGHQTVERQVTVNTDVNRNITLA